MVSSGSRYIVVFVQCVRVVQLNCVKVQCMAYRKAQLKSSASNTCNKTCRKAPAKVITMNVSRGNSKDSPSPH